MDFETVIGLEIHVELDTKTKIFCECTTEFGGEPNTHCCPICAGMPGTLPVLNKKVVEYAVRAGIALNCDISRLSKMDRKNYFYPDLPKAYQISQYDLPICKDGSVQIEVDGQKKTIGITRIHIEEDAGKLLHEKPGVSLADYNRGGVPLIEIVTEPDLRSAEEARVFAEKLKSILEYTEVSDCKMQEGSLRFDVNLSVRQKGQPEFGTRTEMKNLNSFRSLVNAIKYESGRQIKVLQDGGSISQETRRWDDSQNKSFAMRSKEEAHDYRYFPEPDLVPIELEDEWIEAIKKDLPEMPEVKKKRFVDQYELPDYDSDILTSSKALANFFEKCMEGYDNPKNVSNWIMGEVLRILKEQDKQPDEIPFKPKQLVDLLKMVDKGTISGNIGKKVLSDMFETCKDPGDIVKEKGLVQISDEGELLEIIAKVLEDNPKSVEDYRNGKQKAIGFLVGQTMKATRGKANPQMVNKLIREQLQ
ncbi:MAG: Asp-tRNA(Asn)/Glu-tRNA(Gln) amidotransferase subunit GatB [Clostridia bacterium]|nr:Asp-tRNA(Asn)/Glu-tRNA(Gln) amidotransferase subunit GatB [Clostridia bacterium]